MVARLPQVSGQELVKALNKKGFIVVSEKKHIKMRKDSFLERVTVMIPRGNVKKGTLSNILSVAGLSGDDLRGLL